jgi:transcriptional regulator with XRE-family HTH domain
MKTIQELREAYGWTHWELAIRIGVRPGMIKDWESGRSRPRSIQMRRITEVFGVSRDFISHDVKAPDAIDEES